MDTQAQCGEVTFEHTFDAKKSPGLGVFDLMWQFYIVVSISCCGRVQSSWVTIPARGAWMFTLEAVRVRVSPQLPHHVSAALEMPAALLWQFGSGFRRDRLNSAISVALEMPVVLL